MGKIADFVVSQVVPHLDADGDGKFTVDDLKAAARKAEDELKARQTNWYHAAIAAAISAAVSVAVCLLLRH